MYVIPFSMGPFHSPISKIGIQLTDSPYVAASMQIMTRVGLEAFKCIEEGEPFVKCLHTVGQPLPLQGKIRFIVFSFLSFRVLFSFNIE